MIIDDVDTNRCNLLHCFENLSLFPLLVWKYCTDMLAQWVGVDLRDALFSVVNVEEWQRQKKSLDPRIGEAHDNHRKKSGRKYTPK